MQCDLIQGYVESPPLSCEDFRSRYLGPSRREAVAACCQERRAS